MQDEKALIGTPGKAELSIIRDPFKTEHVSSINIHCQVFRGQGRWNAQVDFRAGLTAGMQETGTCTSFDEVLEKLRAIMNEVQLK